MILDSLQNAALYYAINPRLKSAFEWLADNDLAKLAVGRHDIDGDNIFVNIMEPELKMKQDAKLEIHHKYLDIQVMIAGAKEDFGWSECKNCLKPQSEFNVEKDIVFFDDAPQTYYTMRKGQFSIFFPNDAHAPMVGTGSIKKAIVKVLI